MGAPRAGSRARLRSRCEEGRPVFRPFRVAPRRSCIGMAHASTPPPAATRRHLECISGFASEPLILVKG